MYQTWKAVLSIVRPEMKRSYNCKKTPGITIIDPIRAYDFTTHGYINAIDLCLLMLHYNLGCIAFMR